VFTTDDASHRLSSMDVIPLDARFGKACETSQTIDEVGFAVGIMSVEWTEPKLVFSNYSTRGAHDYGHLQAWEIFTSFPPSIESPWTSLSSSASPSAPSPAHKSSYGAMSPASLVLYTAEDVTATASTSSLLRERDLVFCEGAG
jgi:hypothetical protein